ncbi:iron-siderophore ABC transporter substrate-binding protein [Timonella sp. A28]|uniref:iron-siderophore ABC transporter substrate-binding protein n=1 Tax=Timonella sp. A28 TaxID=3442640 RepID=UPI003EB7683C
MHTRRPKILTAAALLIAGALALSGCSDSSTAAKQTSSPEFEAVTIEHALGTAKITEQPERVVTLGMGSAETVIALGTTPVGVEEYPWGSDDTGYLPWIHEAITKQGTELPTQFTGSTELDIEAVLALEPDLILAPWSGVTQEQYDLLADIAPTVAYEKEPWVITWQEQIQVIGKALGKTQEAEQLITDLNSQLAEAGRDEYKDVTFSYIYNTGPGSLGVFFETEQRVAMVSALGLTVDPVVAELREYEVEGTDSALIGLENADKLANSDLIFTFYSDPQNKKEIEAQPLYQQIPAIAQGAIVAPTDQPFVTGSSIINPLTVPWALERFVPLVDEALAKTKK